MIRPFTFLAAFALPMLASATSHMIMSAGFVYTPATLNAAVGDTVVFMLDFSIHPTLEVDQATWNSNGSTPLSGGFNFNSGSEEEVVLTSAGTRYYVCENHVGRGMKGQIVVAPVANKLTLAANAFRAYPNPASSEINLPAGGRAVKVLDAQGRVATQATFTEGQRRTLSLSGLAPGAYTLLVDEQRYAIVKD